MITFAVLLPLSGRFVAPKWAIGLASLDYPLGCSRITLSATSPNRARNRNDLVKIAIQHKCKYLLFLDDDTQPPMDAIKKLFMALETADDDVAACGGIYTSKEIPSEPLVYMEEDGGPFWKWKAGDIFQCQGIGTGCLMIKASAFEKIPEPWFRDISQLDDVGDDPALADLNPELGQFRMTDDLYFARKVQKAGMKMLAHGGVLCVHWDQHGNPHTMPRDSYPMTGAGDQWYAPFGVIEANLVNTRSRSQLPDGFLALDEADALLGLARGKKVLEMGAYMGRSTVCMALSAESVTSVDWHQGDIHLERSGNSCNSLATYLENIRPYPNVKPVIGRFEDEIPKLAGQEFQMVFVDGAHDLESVKRDMAMAMSFNPEVICVHDWGLFEVTEAIDSMGIKPSRIVNTLAVFDMKAA